MERVLLLSFFFLLMGCETQSNDVLLYQVNIKKPMIVCAHKGTNKASNMLIDYFYSVTRDVLHVFDPNQPKEADVKICLEIGEIENDIQAWYSIFWKADTLIIRATTEQNLEFAVQQFALKFLNYYPFEDRVSEQKKKLAEVRIPKNYTETFKPTFEYREPYFLENYKDNLKSAYKTHSLDQQWLIWGHNIRKHISITSDMMAEIEGMKNEEQLCFSSPQLLKSIEEVLPKLISENPNASKVMLMPDDNALSCTCSRCTALGNSKTNASPAVFSAVNRLAKKFPKQQFFSTAYVSTHQPPSFSLEPNAGVMISTMNFPKGIVLENHQKKQEICEYFNSWKAISKHIYLWDYVVHFDHYMHSYPTVLSTQKNLVWFSSLGVNGVFLHGNDESIAAFSDVKHFVYSQLLLNPNLDATHLITVYFNHFYPQAAEVLIEYYLTIENKNLSSTIPLDIYGGWFPSMRKYADVAALQKTYDALKSFLPKASLQEKERIEALLLSFSYQLLEYRRLLGFQPEGIASFDVKTQKATLRKNLASTLEHFFNLAKSKKIEVISESKFTTSDYYRWWRSEILLKIHQNRLYDAKIEVLSKLDEDYNKPQFLNDGAIGLFEYTNNLLIQTIEPLEVVFDGVNLKGAQFFEISTLDNSRHRIFAPDFVKVVIGDKEYIAKESKRISTSDNKVSKVYYQVAIADANEKKVVVSLHPKSQFSKFGMAVDEIIIR
jgi:hypothetical protein